VTNPQHKKKIVFKVSLPQGGISLHDLGELFESIGSENLHEKYDIVISCAEFGDGENDG
jgi:hypothetical protein